MLAVGLGAPHDLALALDGAVGGFEDVAHLLKPPPLRTLLEKCLLELRRKLKSRSNRKREQCVARVRRVDLGFRKRHNAGEERQSSLDERVPRDVVCIIEGRYLGGVEGPSFGEFDDAEPLSPFNHDVQSAVLEPLDVDDVGERPNIADAVRLISEDEAKRKVLLKTLANQLAVAELEDVQGNLLGRKQHDPKRKEPDGRHTESVRERLCGGNACFERGGERVAHRLELDTVEHVLEEAPHNQPFGLSTRKTTGHQIEELLAIDG